MDYLAYTPTTEEKKLYMNKVRKLVIALFELGYDDEEIDHKATNAFDKALSVKYNTTVIISFKEHLKISETVYKWLRQARG